MISLGKRQIGHMPERPCSYRHPVEPVGVHDMLRLFPQRGSPGNVNSGHGVTWRLALSES